MHNSISASTFSNVNHFSDIDNGTLSLDLPVPDRQQEALTSCQSLGLLLPTNADTEMTEAAKWLERPLFKDSDWRKTCLVYTAGFVARRIQEKITCKTCINALATQGHNPDKGFSFLNKKK